MKTVAVLGESNKGSLFARLAKMDPSDFGSDRFAVPVLNQDIVMPFHQEPNVKSTIDFDFNYLTLEKVKYVEPPLYEHSSCEMRSIWYKIEGQARHNIAKLRANDIPVFNFVIREFPEERRHHYSQIVIEYDIPEELMYKSFYVLYRFSEATEKGAEYAKQRVAEFVDNYKVY